MASESNALVANPTWELVPFDPIKNPARCKWVLMMKEKPNGSIECYKARLVTLGFKQQPFLDYDETFSLVVKPITIRVVLSLTLNSGWSIRQLNVKECILI